MTIAEQIAELASLEVGASVAMAVSAGVWPLKLLWWGVQRMLEALG